jgi:hypothetical protein
VELVSGAGVRDLLSHLLHNEADAGNRMRLRSGCAAVELSPLRHQSLNPCFGGILQKLAP